MTVIASARDNNLCGTPDRTILLLVVELFILTKNAPLGMNL